MVVAPGPIMSLRKEELMSRISKEFKDDFTHEDTWRIFRIMSEFVEGFEVLF